MVHFLRRRELDGGSSHSTGAIMSRSPRSGASAKAGSTSFTTMFNLEDQKLLLDYMAEKLIHNPCTAMSIDITSVPKGIMTYYDSFSESFNEGNSNDVSAAGGLHNSSLAEMGDDSEDVSIRTSGVRFGSVEVREYSRTVGDHPDVSDDGPPLTIDWNFVQLEPIPIGHYEAKKRKRRKRRLDRRNQKLRLQNKPEIKTIPNLGFTVPRIKGPVRRELLHLEFDVSFLDLVRAELEVKRVAQQREDSNAQSALSEKTEELLQSATRKLRRSFVFGYGRNYHPTNTLPPPKHLLDRRQLRRSKASITPTNSSSFAFSQYSQEDHHSQHYRGS